MAYALKMHIFNSSSWCVSIVCLRLLCLKRTHFTLILLLYMIDNIKVAIFRWHKKKAIASKETHWHYHCVSSATRHATQNINIILCLCRIQQKLFYIFFSLFTFSLFCAHKIFIFTYEIGI